MWCMKNTWQSANKQSRNSGICLLKNRMQLGCLWGDTLIDSIWSLFSPRVCSIKIKKLLTIHQFLHSSVTVLSPHQSWTACCLCACQNLFQVLACTSLSLLSTSCFAFCCLSSAADAYFRTLDKSFCSQINSCFWALFIMAPITH